MCPESNGMPREVPPRNLGMVPGSIDPAFITDSFLNITASG